ncbi:hypothetical protein P153DRAFT_110566 [Dothidotthia symphoricarpi CBS 119687]|uniref:Uncharacterized protein n=1 Tax=Dothidotthia symphoricarpi CBS 119687 TaxID=1392245 RepID=A0A6A6A230_9PLEO|nr:uncharacterized protein P153DRAFT_110566 [Dothidotthia symphoricarpi CBS 119687]KAF2125255.1 hypothetical protein P153DRAFT_110566 [Dothidotthia symphoricarpi CBS 119687]
MPCIALYYYQPTALPLYTLPATVSSLLVGLVILAPFASLNVLTVSLESAV